MDNRTMGVNVPTSQRVNGSTFARANALVLGATGFIGGQVARAAVGRGWQVAVLRRRPDAVGAIGDLDVEWVSGDLADPTSLAAAMQGRDVVFHCAAAYPHGTRHIERHVAEATIQMQCVLDAARQAAVKRFVYTSSFTTIGPPADAGRLADERDAYQPGSAQDAYYEAKWAMEELARQAAADGQPVVIICPAAGFGPGDVHLSVSEIIVLTARGRMPFYFEATMGAIDVRDLAEAHLEAALCGRPGERYLLSGHNITLREGLVLAAQAAGVRLPWIKIGPRLLNTIVAAGRFLPGGTIGHLRTIRFWQPFNNTKAVQELGLAPRPLAETLADALAWFQEKGYLSGSRKTDTYRESRDSGEQ